MDYVPTRDVMVYVKVVDAYLTLYNQKVPFRQEAEEFKGDTLEKALYHAARYALRRRNEWQIEGMSRAISIHL